MIKKIKFAGSTIELNDWRLLNFLRLNELEYQRKPVAPATLGDVTIEGVQINILAPGEPPESALIGSLIYYHNTPPLYMMPDLTSGQLSLVGCVNAMAGLLRIGPAEQREYLMPWQDRVGDKFALTVVGKSKHSEQHQVVMVFWGPNNDAYDRIENGFAMFMTLSLPPMVVGEFLRSVEVHKRN